jgi:putative membrane protein
MKNMNRSLMKIALFCSALSLASCSNHNAESPDSKEHADKVNDETFDHKGEKDADRVVDLHCANLYEIQSSQEATSKASTADVKKLAAMMVEAHTKMDHQISELAGRKSITLPGEMTDSQRKDIGKLNEKTGIDYDKEYLDQMKSAHDDAETKLQKLADNAEDPDVKQMAATALPEIRSHKDMIESTRNNVKDMKSEARKEEKMH